ncbi:hypothetical protein PanWU01x14_150760 [Parasponia andersonii]|uniref:Endonuclease/exonuclease/phosphatase n=1 Tax=Parasponia andersonii TaxID=3476 RepID=A0A2P5CHZ6_PARAD|nr:hypothetical protein PanWU01x14_150760 [Parasponia andersonii]
MNREVYASDRDQMNLFLVGKVLGNRTVNLEGLQRVLNLVWRISNPFTIEKMSAENVFLFMFTRSDGRQQVFTGVLEDFEVFSGNMRVRDRIDVTVPLSKGIRCLMEDLGKEVSILLWNRYEYENNRPSSKAEGSNVLGEKKKQTPELSISSFSRERIYYGDEAREVEEEMAAYGIDLVKQLQATKILEYNSMYSIEPVYVSTNRKFLINEERKRVSQGVELILLSYDNGKGKNLASIDANVVTEDAVDLKGKSKVIEHKKGAQELFLEEHSVALRKIFKDKLTSKKKGTPKGGKGACGYLRKFRKHSPIKSGLGLSPEYSHFLQAMSPSKTRKIKSPMKMFLSFESIGGVVTEEKVHWRFTSFYGHLSQSKRKFSSDLLRRLNSLFSLPYVCDGDFNEILSLSEKVRGSEKGISRMVNFQCALADCQLSDLGFVGPMLIWNNKRDRLKLLGSKQRQLAFLYDRSQEVGVMKKIRQLEKKIRGSCENEDEIIAIIEDYFDSIFRSSLRSNEHMVRASECISNWLSREGPEIISKPFTPEEVTEALFAMGPYNAPSPTLADSVYTCVGLVRLPRALIAVNMDSAHRGFILGIGADLVHICVGLGRLPQAEIVVNMDPVHKGYMWAIEYGPPSKDARPLTGGDCNAPSPTSNSRPIPYLCGPWKAATGRNRGEYGPRP